MTVLTQGYTSRLADFAVGTPFSALSAEAVTATKRVIADTIACSVSGHDTEPGRVISAFRAEQGGRPDATLVVSGERVPAASAVFVNAQLANILDADDTILNFNHFASTIVMPALATAEVTGAGGREVIAAVACGFELATRIGLGLRDLESPDAGAIERTNESGVSWAALGTAATCGRLLGLDAEGVAHAMGLAYFMAPLHGALKNYLDGIGHRTTPWHKYAMFGSVAEAGTQAAGLVARGFKADPALLEPEKGFWHALGAAEFDWTMLEDAPDARWWIAETSLKPYPFCRLGHGAFDIFAAVLADEGLAFEEIDAVEFTIPPFPTLEKMMAWAEPVHGLDIMASVPFACALIAAGVPAGPRWWDPAHLADERLRAFAQRVRFRVEPAWRSVLIEQLRGRDGKFRRFPVELVVHARGREFRAATEYMKGDPWGSGDAPMTDADVAGKVLEYCRYALGDDGARALAVAAFGLDEAPDVRALVAAMVR